MYFYFFIVEMKGLGKFLLLISSILVALIIWNVNGGDNVSAQTKNDIRINLVQQLIDTGFNHFVTLPFGAGTDSIVLQDTWDYPDYRVQKVFTGEDDLDRLIEENDPGVNFQLNGEHIKTLKTVYLFKNEQDLRDLWYVVSSYRTRLNTDDEWRRDNIFISYYNIGNTRLINSQETLWFMDEVHYDANNPGWKKSLAYGRANMWGMKRVYGWGICGGAWGINAAVLSNKAIEIVERFEHSNTYRNLYKNEINGELSWTPGLDTAVYSLPWSTKDYKIKNIRPYPVILVMNFDGSVKGTETVFVLSKIEDRGYLKYIGKQGACYTWEANERKFTSCYKKVMR